jgi:LysR family transcriptional regulator, glycine cleavage system transcriptional activator
VNAAIQNRTSIKLIQAFEAAARLGSFAAAADKLAVTPSVVSHHVKLPEEQLGITLFHRDHRAVVPTEAGRHYAAEIIAGRLVIPFTGDVMTAQDQELPGLALR